MTGRDDPPPHDLAAERAVLGACLINPKAADRTADLLTEADFYRAAHALIWRAIRTVTDRSGVADLITVRDALGAADLERVGGVAYLAALDTGVPKSTNVEHYAAIVRHRRCERDLQAASVRLDVNAIRAAAEALDDASLLAADPASTSPFVSLADAESGSMVPAVVLPGLAWRGSISVIGGAPKDGKSTLIGQAIAAACNGRPFLGQPASCGLVAIITEEPVRLAAARLRALGVAPDAGVYIAPAGARGALPALRRLEAGLIVIDSFTAFAVAAGAETMNDAAAMRRILNQLRGLAEAGAAVLLVHHVRKSDGALADSRDIGASVDVMLDFYPVKPGKGGELERCPRADSDRRRLVGVGRWPVDTLTLDYIGGDAYHVAAAGGDQPPPTDGEAPI